MGLTEIFQRPDVQKFTQKSLVIESPHKGFFQPTKKDLETFTKVLFDRSGPVEGSYYNFSKQAGFSAYWGFQSELRSDNLLCALMTQSLKETLSQPSFKYFIDKVFTENNKDDSSFQEVVVCRSGERGDVYTADDPLSKDYERIFWRFTLVCDRGNYYFTLRTLYAEATDKTRGIKGMLTDVTFQMHELPTYRQVELLDLMSRLITPTTLMFYFVQRFGDTIKK